MTDFAELKQRHAAVWSNGAFEDIADSLRDMHETLVRVLGPHPGERWLDVGCGAGNVAELAAGAGARVTGIDLSPRLIGVARARAEASGYDIDYRVGDAESLDVEDAGFDAVVSSVAMIFAPDHAAVAAEVARVTRPGGRLAFSAWTSEGTVGGMLERLRSFQPPTPEGAGSALQWGSEDYVRDRLGDAFELAMDRRFSTFEAESADAAWELFSTKFGPTKTLIDNLPPERLPAFRETMVSFLDENRQADGRIVERREYLLVSGVRR